MTIDRREKNMSTQLVCAEYWSFFAKRRCSNKRTFD